MIEIYTDGSTRKTGVGGYGFIVIENGQIVTKVVQKELNTTNQRCELLALIAACDYCKIHQYKEVTIYSDSAYCLNAKYNKWYVKWEENGWKTAKNQPVRNKDLWEKLIPYYKEDQYIFVKVQGHSDCYYNNVIDKLVTTLTDPTLHKVMEVEELIIC